MYRTVDSAFWTDPKVKTLPPDGLLLFLYFITNPHNHVSGIYYILKSTIQAETRLSGRAIDTLCDTLSSLRLCRFDPQMSLVWVVRMMEYQARGEKARKSAAHHIIEDLHKSPIINEFLQEYPEIKKELSAAQIDTLTIGYPAQDQVATPDSPFLNPESSILNPEQKGSAPPAPESRLLSLGEFEQVRMTPEELEKLREQMNGRMDSYIADLDLYSQTQPAKFKKYKNHYAVIRQWHNRDVKEGKIRGEQSGGNSGNSGSSGSGPRLNRPYTPKQRTGM